MFARRRLGRAQAGGAQGAALTPPDDRGARLQSLDVVRGVAVMGILLLNIIGFAMPDAAYYNPRAYGGWHGADLGAWLVNFILFDGKMRGLFSFLFGASMLLVIERAEAGGRSGAQVHFTRMAWLLVFGLAHLWLVWDGDILAHYALVGMFALACRHMPVPRLLVLGAMLAALSAVFFALFPLMVVDLQSPAADAAEAGQKARELKPLIETFGVPSPAHVAQQLALYRGDYAALVADRFETNRWPVRMLIFYGPETLAYMLFGMAALRSGMLAGRWEPGRYRRWLLVCWGVALPAQIALAAAVVAAQFSLFSVAFAFAASAPLRPPLILGWVCLVLLLARPGGALTGRVAAAGRMAFTNYIATSLICTALFYGHGFGWYGQLSRWQLYPVVALVCALMLAWSAPWLARFRFGPMEWLWRSLARGALQPIRRS